MPRNAHQKEKLLVLLNILKRRTDDAHPISVPALIAELEKENISAERKSIYDDIAVLQDRGYDIELTRGKGYYLASREFELPELKLLVDAVQASRFISEKKSESLIKKLKLLCSDYQGKSLQRQVYGVKTANETVLYAIDHIHEAIADNRRLTFRYFDFDVHKNKIFRHDGKRYEVSPVGLLRNDESYYLVAIPEGSAERRHYRVDRMDATCVSDQPRVPGCENVDMSIYNGRLFGMFTGEERPVKLRCPNNLIHVMLDRFGLDIMPIPDGEEHFTITVSVAVSQQFFGWLFGIGPEIEIVSPPDVREEYHARLRSAVRSEE